MLDKTRKVMTGASTGIAVAAAFINVALIVVQLVKTVSQDEALATADAIEQKEEELKEIDNNA